MNEADKISPTRQKFDDLPIRKTCTKVSLEFLRRTLFYFDIPTIAQDVSGTSTSVYRALLKQPINRDEAEKILAGLSLQHSIHPPLTLNEVNIPTHEDFMVLYVVMAEGNQDEEPEVALVYAEDERHAKKLLASWARALSHRTVRFIPQKDGIPMYGGARIPGHNGMIGSR